MCTIRTLSRFHYELPSRLLVTGRGCDASFVIVMFRIVGIGPLDLHETFAADQLVTAACAVHVRRIVHEAERTLGAFLVEEYFQGLAIHEWVIW